MGDISLKGKSPILRQSFAIGGIAKHAVRRITDRLGGGKEGKPHSTKAGRIASGVRKLKRGAKKLGEPFVKEATTWETLRKKKMKWKPHGGVGGPMVKAEGGRIGLNKGGKPWGTGPKPGTHEFMVQNLHKRKGKAAGSIVKGGIKAGKRFLDFIKTGKHVDKHGVKTNVPKAAERLTGKPHVDRVKKAPGGPVIKRSAEKVFEHFGGGEKGKPHSSKEGRIAAGKQNIKRLMAQRKQWKTPDWKRKPDRKLQPYSPGRPQAPSRPKKTWPPKHSDLLKRFPKMPQPHKAPGDKPYIPMPKHDPNKPKKWKEAAEGGRIGLKKGGSDKNWIQKAVNPKHKGYCTPMTKKTCTPARKALARTFKKMGRERKAKG